MILVDTVAAIMLVVERHDPVHQALNRALVLARHFHARLDLVLYDDDYVDAASAPRTALDSARQRSARDYLEALRGSIDSPGVEITIDVVGGMPLPEAVVHKVLNRCPDLVVRCSHSDRRGEFARSDMRLVRVCPAPVLLTTGRPWRARPRLAAVVDICDRHGRETPLAVTAMGKCLRAGCEGDLDILYAGPDTGAGERGAMQDEIRRRLAELRTEGGVDEAHLRAITPSAPASLARLVESRGIDVLIHAVPDPQPDGPGWTGTAQLDRQLAPLDCDLLFVRPGRYQRYDRPAVS